jgi:hypothetical protein
MGRGEFNEMGTTLFEDNILHLPKWPERSVKNAPFGQAVLWYLQNTNGNIHNASGEFGVWNKALNSISGRKC